MAFNQNVSSKLLQFKVFGIGGAGCNFVARTKLSSIAVGSNSHDLSRCPKARKLVLSEGELRCFAETDPSVLTPRTLPIAIRECFDSNDISILVAGLGGVTGSYGIRFFSSASRIMGKMAICLVSTPFGVESEARRILASDSREDLKKRSNLLICFENDKLKKLVPQLPINKAFDVMNAIMERPAIDFSNVMTASDITPLKELAKKTDIFRLGVGLGSGRLREFIALEEALESPWFDFNLESVAVAYAIISSSQTAREEVDDVDRELRNKLPNCKSIIRSYNDQSLGDSFRVTLLLGRPLKVEE